MSIPTGTRIGAYEVTGALGAGGMGEVYQARDIKLNRTVALKLLPPALASDPDRLARFKREAQVLASLNHPNIAAIYGIEESPSGPAGPLVLVMEFVPGRTLAELISAPMPAADALPIARQIAAALEAAHERGVVHRDLKPANIKLTDDGTVKVLDFGLAKALGAPGSSDPTHPDAANSPTLTSPAITEMGMILGTAGYMAPEQAKGKPVDRRADIWALGVVLFEMLAGRSLYRGETVTETIAHVITQPPDWQLLPASTPAPVLRLLRRCLEKDPRNRKQSAGDVRVEIDECLSPSAGDAATPSGASPVTPPAPLWRRALPWALAAGLAAALAYVAWPQPALPQPLVRFDVRLAAGNELTVEPNNDGAIVTLSPDGQTLVYSGQLTTNRRLYVRRLDRLESDPIAGTEGAEQQFFSPDSKSIGFATPGMLMRTQLGGGTPVPILAVSSTRGATWGPDNTIVYTGDMTSGLMRVPVAGGTPQQVTTLGPNERTHRWPWFLPDGQAVLFMCQMVNGSYDDGTIEAVRVEGGPRKVLIRGGTFPRYVEPGYLVYTRHNVLYAVRFNPRSLEVAGEPQPVMSGIMGATDAVGAGSGNGAAQISIASNGTAVHLPAVAQTASLIRLAIVDRAGKITYQYPEPRLFRDPRFSPDGRRLALRVGVDRTEHLHILDIARGTLTRIVFDGAYSGVPVWSRDGEAIAFAWDKGGRGLEVYMAKADGTESRKVFDTGGSDVIVPTSFSSDGRLLALMDVNAKTNMDILVASVGDRKVTPFLNTPSVEGLGAFSPDDKWMAYQVVDNNGASEVFVRAYPDGSGLRQVSNSGGAFPCWTKNGREIVYLAGKSMMAVDVGPEGSTLALGKPHKLFDLPIAEPLNAVIYDAFPDGSRFAVLLTATQQGAPAPAPRTHATVTLNLIDEIRRVVK